MSFPETAFVAARRPAARSPSRVGSARSAWVEADRTELLARLLSRHQDALFRYIFSLLPHEEDARDVLQQTSLALVGKADEYDSGQPFLAWAYRFAYLEVLKQRERNQRNKRHLNPALIERLAREREQREPELLERLSALEQCLEQLPPADRELIRQRYQGSAAAEEVAAQRGTSRRTLFRELERIRRVLLDCVNRRLASGQP
jgi:RNA polymerase sigma-70 factor (ECF subfamily)